MKWFGKFFEATPAETRRILVLISFALVLSTIPFLLSNFYLTGTPALRTDLLADLPVLERDSGKSAYFRNTAGTEEFDPDMGARFYFDPNTLSESGWKQLGFTDRNVVTINNYKATGARFYKPEDLNKIYTLNKELVKAVIPYVRIADQRKEFVKKTTNARDYQEYEKQPYERKPFTPRSYSIVSVNTADSFALVELPGIGHGYARRILTFRDRLGGFYSVEQIAETFGLPDSVYQKAKPYLQVDPQEIRKMNINTDDAATLKHPYLRWNIINAIVAYRKQHGDYTSVEEIKKIRILPDSTFQKIAPYLTVGND